MDILNVSILRLFKLEASNYRKKGIKSMQL